MFGCLNLQEDRNAVETLWSGAIVPYAISDELGGLLCFEPALMYDQDLECRRQNSFYVFTPTAYQVSNIYAAFKMISDFTCIRFQQRTTELNYLKFLDGNG